MLVDDSRINVRLCERKLKLAFGEGAHFLNALDGFEAVSKYSQMLNTIGTPAYKQVHAILMVYHMPKMNGKDAIIEIRRIEKEKGAQRVPIAAYTAGMPHYSNACPTCSAVTSQAHVVTCSTCCSRSATHKTF